MSALYRSLPSIQTLRCFEAAARHGSFTAAAEEICITHSAVSHQIRSLEEAIGQPLFMRQGNRMVLTVAGRSLAAETRRALDYLSQAYAVAHVEAAPRQEILSFAVQIGLAEHFVLPRLHQLKETLGAARLRFTSLPDLGEKCPDDTDIALVYGTGDVPGMIAEKVAEEVVFPVCSPDFLARHPGLTPERMAGVPLLLHSQVTWNLWLEKANLPILYPAHSTLLDDIALTIRGALEGQGIAMARSLLVRDYLARGELVRLFDLCVPGIFAYHLACRTKKIRERHQPMIDWIIGEMVAAPSAALTAPK